MPDASAFASGPQTTNRGALCHTRMEPRTILYSILLRKSAAQGTVAPSSQPHVQSQYLAAQQSIEINFPESVMKRIRLMDRNQTRPSGSNPLLNSLGLMVLLLSNASWTPPAFRSKKPDQVQKSMIRFFRRYRSGSRSRGSKTRFKLRLTSLEVRPHLVAIQFLKPKLLLRRWVRVL